MSPSWASMSMTPFTPALELKLAPVWTSWAEPVVVLSSATLQG